MSQLGFGALFLYFFCFSILRTSATTLDIINPIQSLRDGDTLVSAGRIFELGFFSLADSNRRYLGLWYKKISPRTIVWVANRETPLSNTSGSLNITAQGDLVLVNGTNDNFWSSNTSNIAKHPVAELLDSGNFVVRDANDSNPENFLWQSFDYPVDTTLPGMKLGVNFVTGHETFSSSWKSSEDPASGQFSAHLDLGGYPQLFLKKENRILYRAGSWNGLRLTGTPNMNPNPFFSYEFVWNDKEVYFKYDILNDSNLVRYTISPSGLLQRFSWDERANDWVVIATAQTDQCENYAFCGAFGSCEVNNSPVCLCLDGFMPKSPRDWNMLVWSDGCVRRTPLNCSDGDGFLKHSGIKLPDTSSSRFDQKIDLAQCRDLCLRNCSCSAYANLDERGGGSGCLLWFDDLIDIRGLAASGQDLYVRVAASELGMFM